MISAMARVSVRENIMRGCGRLRAEAEDINRGRQAVTD